MFIPIIHVSKKYYIFCKTIVVSEMSLSASLDDTEPLHCT